MISLLNSQMWKEKEDKMKDEVGSESDASFLFARKLHEYKEHDSTDRTGFHLQNAIYTLTTHFRQQ